MKILAIDPGNESSAYILFDGGKVVEHGFADNELVRVMLGRLISSGYSLAIEMIACFGMPVGAEVFQTCVWIGRFIERWNGMHQLVYRKDVKMHLCGQSRAKDANIRQAIIDRFGGKAKAVGLKSCPGPLYGIKSHCWAALAVALTVADSPTAGGG